MRRSVENKPINVALIGMGNVGTGVVRWFQDGGGEQFNLHLKKVVVRDLTKPRQVHFSGITDNPKEILSDPSIDIVVELMGGVDLAREFALTAINNGKSVVNANKALLARHMGEIFAAARKNQVNLGFEASVAGGIPIINILKRLRGERINSFTGIINGTANYILTKMTEDKQDFAAALKEAQDQGYAEADPTADIEGFDTQNKLAVLASLAFNTQINVEKIPCTGITGITPADIDFAEEAGYAIKLLGIANREGNNISLRVTPALLRKEHPLAAVREAFNMIFVEGEWVGPQTFSGKGAGERPTTSAVISDILHVAENMRKGTIDELPSLNSRTTYANPGKIVEGGYIRTDLIDKPGSIHAITGIFARRHLNFRSIIQKDEAGIPTNGDIVKTVNITIKPAPHWRVESALRGMQKSDRVYGQPFFLPIVD